MRAMLLFAFISFSTAHAGVQSEFRGPAKLRVWKHWQQSWNVENATKTETQFTLERGTDSAGAYVRLRFLNSRANLRAQVRCDGYVRTGNWSVQERSGSPQTVMGRPSAGWVEFRITNASECIDKLGERIVTGIEFQVLDGTNSIYQYTVKPMYVRGAKTAYWNNPIDSYSAHAGNGEISIATSLSGESGWDQWSGVLVKPVLSFVDRNTLNAGATIGLHRHEANQEVYLVETGQMTMVAGVASRSGANYQASRVWEKNGRTQMTDEFEAVGGWIEERTLGPGEVSVIVPDSRAADTVYFHGIRALSDATFWTMGTKN